jgi:(p)ppGpp synthase/HD superfamily hydrolase
MEAHAGQKYADGPYLLHLFDVYNILIEYGQTNPNLLAAGLLHDVIEDTPYHYSDISRKFGDRVADLVYACTDDLGRNRKERKRKTWPRFVCWIGENGEDALYIKTADWIAHVRRCYQGAHADKGKLAMYQKDWSVLRELLKGFPELSCMLAELTKMLDSDAPDSCAT